MNDLVKEDLELEVKEGFKVYDLASANWCFRKLRALAEKEAEIEAISKNEIDRINYWKNKEEQGIKESKEYFEMLLKEYYSNQKAIDSKFKCKTPYGSISSRKTKNIDYDESKMLDYLKVSHPDMIQTVEKFNKAEVKKIIKGNVDINTGEILDFVTEVTNENINVKVEI